MDVDANRDFVTVVLMVLKKGIVAEKMELPVMVTVP